MAAYFAGTQNEFTVVINAVMYGRADCARLLLDAGADKEATDRVRAGCGLRVGHLAWGVG